MTRIKKIIYLVNDRQLIQEREKLKLICNRCWKVFEQDAAVQAKLDFIYITCKSCRASRSEVTP